MLLHSHKLVVLYLLILRDLALRIYGFQRYNFSIQIRENHSTGSRIEKATTFSPSHIHYVLLLKQTFCTG